MAAALAVATLAFGASFAAASSKSGSLKGAGSTFVFPLVSQWQANYKNAQITYGSVGSAARPPSTINMTSGVQCQISTSTRLGITNVGEYTHSDGGSPTSDSK